MSYITDLETKIKEQKDEIATLKTVISRANDKKRRWKDKAVKRLEIINHIKKYIGNRLYTLIMNQEEL